MKTSQKGFIAPLLLALIAILLIGGGVYVYMLKSQRNPAEDYSCPNTQGLDYDQETNTYIQFVDCMPHPGDNFIGDPWYEVWVNKTCGIKFKFECGSY